MYLRDFTMSKRRIRQLIQLAESYKEPKQNCRKPTFNEILDRAEFEYNINNGVHNVDNAVTVSTVEAKHESLINDKEVKSTKSALFIIKCNVFLFPF